MFNRHKRFMAGMAPLLFGLGAAGIAMASGQTGMTDNGPVRCAIQAAPANGMMALEGLVHADEPVSGSYRFQVLSAGHSGNANISQGGEFTAGPGGAVTLGKVMLGDTGAIYEATLEVTSNGVTVECAERVGGAI